jgi:tetratricopeptide (TPR) repeat protein
MRSKLGVSHFGLRRLAGFLIVLVLLAIGLVVTSQVQRERFDRRLAEIKLSRQGGNLRGASDALRELYASDDSNVEVIELLADVSIQSGDLSGAIEWLLRVPDSAADRAAAARHRAAELAMQLGRVADSEALALESIQLDSQFAKPRQLLIRLYFVLFQQRKLHEQALLVDGMGALTLIDVAMHCVGPRAAWDNKDHVHWLEQCLGIDPANPRIRAALARYYGQQERYVAARRLLRGSTSDTSDTSDAWWILLTRAEDQIAQAEFGKAYDTLHKLPSGADGESRVWVARGEVCNELGNPSAALVAFANARRLDPYDPAPTYAAARLLQKQGATERARDLFQRSQQQTELMGLMGRLIEASNPAYQMIEPLADSLRSAAELFEQLGLDRESEIMALAQSGPVSVGVLSEPQPTSGNGFELSLASLEELERFDFDVRIAPIPVAPNSVAGAGPRPETRLVDIAEKVGMSFQYDNGSSPSRWIVETLGGGVAVVDFDLDGWQDVFLTQGCTLPVGAERANDTNHLFQNRDGILAADVTTPADLRHEGYGQGCAVGDYDNDGFPDLVVCNYGETLVYQNQGDGTFARVNCGVAGSGWSTSAAFSDLDRDGDLDLYVVNYVVAPYDSLEPCKYKGAFVSCRPSNFEAAPDVFWENLGNGTFAERTSLAGLTAEDGKGLAVMIADFDRHGRESIFVANDTTQNFLFQPTDSQDQGSPFRENGLLSGVAVNAQGLTEACMGIACADVDGDGRFDLFVTNFLEETNTLYRASGDGEFVDDTVSAGLADTSRNRLGFGCQFLDLENDGALDLFVANGQLHAIAQTAQLFYNLSDGRFRDISQQAGRYFRQPRLGRSVAKLDWNRDRSTDLVVTYQTENVSLLENQSAAGHAVALKLVGSVSNRDAVGTLVRVRIGDRESHFQVSRGGGYFAANDPALLVGCGAAERIDELEIRWPSGAVANWSEAETEKNYCVIEGNDRLWEFD